MQVTRYGSPLMIGEREIGHYRDHGYIVVPRLLDAAHVAALRARTDFYLESARDKPASAAIALP